MMSSWDVIVVGAGISGIDAAYRLQERLPHLSFTILEGRHTFGGTWDLFKYPGIRSDSDMFTFSYPFQPWRGGETLTSADKIKAYLNETLDTNDLAKHVQYNSRVVEAEWSSARQRWRLTVRSPEGDRYLDSRFVMFSTGYYDYGKPLPAEIPGIADFGGKVIHPQFWPTDFDYTGKHISIIGSGATAATLLPNLAKKASQVVMVQRSPSYFIAVPNRNRNTGKGLLAWLPAYIRHRVIRFQLAALSFLFFWYCGAFPNSARRFFYRNTRKHLPKDMPLEPHFTPSYRPWEQRVCAVPDGDFFKSIRDGKAGVVTGKIKAVTKRGIEMESGERVDTDVIITATGLQLQFGGGTNFIVDGKRQAIKDLFNWRGIMLSGIPNASFCSGYPNASWTLGADLTAVGFTRVIKQVEDAGATSATATVAEGKPLKSLPLVSLRSTYLASGKDIMPQGGDRAPWLPRNNYFKDWWRSWYGEMEDGLVYT